MRPLSAMPDAAIYTACGNRRATVCPACAQTYQRDAFQLLRAGLVGGKGVPESVASHPAVFATFTAPSFGTVHARKVKRHTCRNRRRCDCRAEPCHPRRATDPTARPCQHGQQTVCWARHEADDARLGQPLCLDCYDYDAQVVWNHAAPELWRRTTIAVTRHLHGRARQLGLPPVVQITASGRLRRVPPVLIFSAAALLETLHLDTGSVVLDEFASRFVFFYSGYVLAQYAFRLASWSERHVLVTIAGVVAWLLLNGVFVHSGLADRAFISLMLGFAFGSRPSFG